MRNEKTNQQSFVHVGTSSLLIIFLIICLVVFAALSLSSAKSDYSFSEKTAARKTAYYTASNTAEEIWADIDSAAATMSEEKFSAYVIDYEKEGISLAYENSLISYSVPVGDNQILYVTLKISPEGSSVREWTTASAEDWVAADHPTLVSAD